MNSNYPRIEEGNLPAIPFAAQVRKSLLPGSILSLWIGVWMVDFPTLYHQANALGLTIPLISTWVSEASIIPILFMISRRLDDRRHLATVAMIGTFICSPLLTLQNYVGKDLEKWPVPAVEFVLFWALLVVIVYLVLVALTAGLFGLRLVWRKLWSWIRRSRVASRMLGD